MEISDRFPGGAPDSARPMTEHGARRGIMIALASICAIIATLGLFTRIMAYPLRHDEQIHVAAGAMLGHATLYRDLGYNHLPNLALLLSGLFGATGDHYLLLSGRLMIFGLWIATAVALALVAWRATRSIALVGLAVLLLIANTLLIGPAGMLVTNNFAPIPFELFGLHLFLCAADGRKSPFWLAAGAGVLIALAIGFKANYLFLAPIFAVAALLVPRDRPIAWRITRIVLPFAIGGIIGALPALFYLVGDPGSFFAHTFRYFTELHATYFDALDEPKAVSMADKIQIAVTVWLSGASLLAACLAGVLLLLPGGQSGAFSFGWRRPGWPVILVAALIAAGILVSFVPTPSFPQYFVPPVPFVIVLAILLFGELDSYERALTAPLLATVAILTLLSGTPRLVGDMRVLAAPTKWTGIKVHEQARRIARIMDAQGARPRIATLSPIHALEAGASIYPEFASGPFLYRVAPLIKSQDLRYFRTVTEANLPAFLDANPPGAILVGMEGDLDRGFVRYAAAHGFDEATLQGGAVRGGALHLYVRRAAPANEVR